MFPEKLSFDGAQHRTTRVNEIASTIFLISNNLQGKKKWANGEKSRLPTRVGHDGHFSKYFLRDLQLMADLAKNIM